MTKTTRLDTTGLITNTSDTKNASPSPPVGPPSAIPAREEVEQAQIARSSFGAKRKTIKEVSNTAVVATTPIKKTDPVKPSGFASTM
jgi:hypothetical protein